MSFLCRTTFLYKALRRHFSCGLFCNTTVSVIAERIAPSLPRCTSPSSGVVLGDAAHIQRLFTNHIRPIIFTQSSSQTPFYQVRGTRMIYSCKFHSSPHLTALHASKNNNMDLTEIVSLLDGFAPTSLAESWDNVGLLVEPTPPHQVGNMLLTNDLTQDVMSEAVNKETDLILSYHPPIFAPLKRLTMKSVKEKIIVQAMEKRIAVYSPHTCYDAVDGGVNDWLVQGLGGIKQCRPLIPSYAGHSPLGDLSISFLSDDLDIASLVQDLSCVNNVTCVATNNGLQISFMCTKSSLEEVMSSLQTLSCTDRQSMQITQLSKVPKPNTGMGRLAELSGPVPISKLVDSIKVHLKLNQVQIALGCQKTMNSEVCTVALCAGSGSSVLRNVKADLYLTGEMSHHDILAAIATGTSVIICNHSNTERGFLRVLQKKLSTLFGGRVNVFVSEMDKDPLEVV